MAPRWLVGFFISCRWWFDLDAAVHTLTTSRAVDVGPTKRDLGKSTPRSRLEAIRSKLAGERQSVFVIFRLRFVKQCIGNTIVSSLLNLVALHHLVWLTVTATHNHSPLSLAQMSTARPSN